MLQSYLEILMISIGVLAVIFAAIDAKFLALNVWLMAFAALSFFGMKVPANPFPIGFLHAMGVGLAICTILFAIPVFWGFAASARYRYRFGDGFISKISLSGNWLGGDQFGLEAWSRYFDFRNGTWYASEWDYGELLMLSLKDNPTTSQFDLKKHAPNLEIAVNTLSAELLNDLGFTSESDIEPSKVSRIQEALRMHDNFWFSVWLGENQQNLQRVVDFILRQHGYRIDGDKWIDDPVGTVRVCNELRAYGKVLIQSNLDSKSIRWIRETPGKSYLKRLLGGKDFISGAVTNEGRAGV